MGSTPPKFPQKLNRVLIDNAESCMQHNLLIFITRW